MLSKAFANSNASCRWVHAKNLQHSKAHAELSGLVENETYKKLWWNEMSNKDILFSYVVIYKINDKKISW